MLNSVAPCEGGLTGIVHEGSLSQVRTELRKNRRKPHFEHRKSQKITSKQKLQ